MSDKCVCSLYVLSIFIKSLDSLPHTHSNRYLFDLQIRATEFSHTVLHDHRPQRPVGGVQHPVGGAKNDISAFKPVAGRLGVVGRPLPPAPRPHPNAIKLDPPPQPSAQPNRRYDPVSVYGGPRRDPDEK